MRTTTEERLEDVARAADSVVNAAVQDFRACVADVENAEKVHAEMRAKKWAVEKGWRPPSPTPIWRGTHSKDTERDKPESRHDDRS